MFASRVKSIKKRFENCIGRVTKQDKTEFFLLSCFFFGPTPTARLYINETASLSRAVLTPKYVVVSSPAVTDPVSLRFAWKEDVQPNLFNKAGLPAEPYMTGIE